MIQILRLTPRDHDGQHVLRWRIEPSADGRLKPGEDAFGNILHIFSADGPVEDLTIRSPGRSRPRKPMAWCAERSSVCDDIFYLRRLDSRAGRSGDQPVHPDAIGRIEVDPLAGLHRLLSALHEEVAFDTAPTHSATTAAEAFALRRGVCQDLTHIFIAGVRDCGIPARYVSGYFHRSDGVTDQDAGHAWAEAKVPDLGWVGFDPANGISAGEAHIRVAVGLDYLGASPVRGSRYGGGSETLQVKLSVESAQGQKQVQG